MDPNPRKNDPHLPDALAQEVLSKYPAPARGRLEALGNRGGFSGACLWRVHTLAGPFCLRAAAPAESRDHVITRHRWMTTARKAGASFVPTIVPTSWNDTVVSVGGRFWEFMSWLPGRADFREAPSPARLRAAAQAVARLHRAWEPLGGAVVPLCPAVARRLEAVACWKGQKSPESDPLIGRIESAVTRWLPRVPGMLAGWLGPWRVQPCLRDI